MRKPHLFAQTLDELPRSAREASTRSPDLGDIRPHWPDVTGALPPSELRAGAGIRIWDRAYAFVHEGEPSVAFSSAPPSDRSEDIARELGLDQGLTLAQLHRTRRRFNWANHPDRNPQLPTDLAGRRVAVANTLIDEAIAARREGDGDL